MHKLLVRSLLISAVTGGIISVNLISAHASTYQVSKISRMAPTAYYAKSAKSGYLWDKKHTKRLHNLKNYPKTTWYATGKCSMKSTKNSGVYLQVANGNGKAKGYIWTGYLKKGVNPAYPQGTLTNPFGAAMSTYNVDNKLNKQLVSLFPGTITDNNLQLAADFSYIRMPGDNGDFYSEVLEQMIGPSEQTSFITFNTEVKMSKSDNFVKVQKKALAKKLSTEGKTFNSFKGYHIGAYAYPKHDKRYGSTKIVLLPY